MANKIVDFTDLIIYQLAVDLADWIYELTAKFPEDERHNLTSQLRRSSTSVYSNIAEGFGRYHYKENKQFLPDSQRFFIRDKSPYDVQP